MLSIKGHFDGAAIVLDEPVALAIGQPVQVVVETALPVEGPSPRPPLAGFAKGMLESRFTPFVEMTAKLINGDEWDESAALHIDSVDAVPADFVRRAGSAAGEIKMTDDFDETPDDFKDYL